MHGCVEIVCETSISGNNGFKLEFIKTYDAYWPIWDSICDREGAGICFIAGARGRHCVSVVGGACAQKLEGKRT